MINSHHKCNRCGECCKAQVCEYGVAAYKITDAPCPGFKNNSCELIDIIEDELKPFIMFRLGIGMGCSNDLKEWGKEKTFEVV